MQVNIQEIESSLYIHIFNRQDKIMLLSKRAINFRALSRCFSSEIKPPQIKKNYYEMLDVPKDADRDTIANKYKELGNSLPQIKL